MKFKNKICQLVATKKILWCTVILLTSQLNLSCKKFLDIKGDSTQSFIENASDCQLLLNDYGSMNTGYPSDGEASADNYYFNSPGYLSSSLSADDRDFYAWQPYAIRATASTQWTYPYKVVYLSNLVLEALDRIKGSTSQDILDDLRGQALFFRAYSFWNIAQLYAKSYSQASAGRDPGIPIRLKSDINGKSERGTLEQTYGRITSDLTEASSLLYSASVKASRPNKASAFAMLARVYLSMEDYDKSLASANEALKLKSDLMDYSSISTSSPTPFVRFNKEVIFQSLMPQGQLLNPGDQTSNNAKIEESLYSLYDGNDLRKLIYFKENFQTAQLKNPAYPGTPGAPQFIDVTLGDGTFRFTGNYEPVTTGGLFNGLAVDELYLTRAEDYARLGNKDAAMADLNVLLKTRWVPNLFVDRSAVDANDALSQILIERRKELVMRGQRWTDARRLKLGFTRQTKNVSFSGFSNAPVRAVSIVNTYFLPAGDLRFTLLIPRDVISNSEIAQNPR